MIIYGLKCPILNEYRYIGQTSRSLKERLFNHVSRALQEKKIYSHKERWIRQLNNLDKLKELKIEIIEDNIKTAEQLDEREIYWIDFYKKSLKDKLTNCAKGGGDYLRFSVKGKNHPCFGKKRPEEERKRFSEARKGEGNPNFGNHFKVTEETKSKISNSLRNSEKFKKSKESPVYKEKLSNFFSQGRELCLLNDKLEVVRKYKNSTELAKEFNCTRGNIKNARRHKRQIGRFVGEKFWVVFTKDLEMFLKEKGT